MLSNYLTNLGLTRDSAVWFWGKLTGAILFLATLGGSDMLVTYGIPLKWQHAIQIAAAWIVYFSAQNSTSQLNGK